MISSSLSLHVLVRGCCPGQVTKSETQDTRIKAEDQSQGHDGSPRVLHTADAATIASTPPASSQGHPRELSLGPQTQPDTSRGRWGRDLPRPQPQLHLPWAPVSPHCPLPQVADLRAGVPVPIYQLVACGQEQHTCLLLVASSRPRDLLPLFA